MEKTLQLISLVLFLLGVFCYILAYQHRKPQHPDLKSVSSYTPKNWIPFWRTKDWYDAKGFRLQSTSAVLIILGSLLSLIYRHIF